MSYSLTQLSERELGAHLRNNNDDGETEREYDRLRGLARASAQKRSQCIQRSQAAWQAGDKATAHELSEEGKAHGLQMERHNLAARDYIFRANSADLPPDTIDLHGLFVEEAKEILEARIQSATRQGSDGLHAIVGKGTHSESGVGKLAPAVARICRELGLSYREEENAGRIYVWLRPCTSGEGVMPPGCGYQQQQHHGAGHILLQHHGGQSGYPGGQQHHGGGHHHQQQQQEPDRVEAVAKKVLPKIFKKMGECCVIM